VSDRTEKEFVQLIERVWAGIKKIGPQAWPRGSFAERKRQEPLDIRIMRGSIASLSFHFALPLVGRLWDKRLVKYTSVKSAGLQAVVRHMRKQ